MGSQSVSRPQVQVLSVSEDADGQRLDNFLFKALKGVPKSHVYRIIRSGEVRINKGRAKADSKLARGDEVRVPPLRMSETAEKKAASIVPGRSFDVIFEDDHVLAINKPAGLAVHGGSGVSFGVIEQLRASYPRQRFLELVHRLDRETSGLLLIAKKSSALKHVQAQFRDRQTKKIYLAAVLGAWTKSQQVLDIPLRKFSTPEGERRVHVVDKTHPDAMRALSIVTARGVGTYNIFRQRQMEQQAVSCVNVDIKTGRTHQIRVHLASLGFPILGDDKYGDFDINKLLIKAKPTPLQRMFLHAEQLTFMHPATGEVLTLTAQLSSELRAFWSTCSPTSAIETLDSKPSCG